MGIRKHILACLAAAALLPPVTAAARPSLAVTLQADSQNPSDPTLGDHLRFWSTIANTGRSPIHGIVAWVSLVEIDPGNEHPVDLEDWSAQKAVTGAALGPGQTLRTDWPLRIIQGGDYRLVVSVTERGDGKVHTSPIFAFHVRPRPLLSAGRILPAAVLTPALFIGLLIGNSIRSRRRRSYFETNYLRKK